MKSTYYSTLTSRGQTTLPSAVRRLLDVNPGDKLQYVIDGDAVTINAIRLDIDSAFGAIRAQNNEDDRSWEQVRRDAWAREAERFLPDSDSQ